MENIRNINPVKVDKTTIINLEKGKLPPQALDLEEAVLGAMMIDKKGVDEVIDILSPEAFYKDAHKYIFEASANMDIRITFHFDNSDTIILRNCGHHDRTLKNP